MRSEWAREDGGARPWMTPTMAIRMERAAIGYLCKLFLIEPSFGNPTLFAGRIAPSFASRTLVRHHVRGSRGELRSELVWGDERPASSRCPEHGVRGSAVGKGGADGPQPAEVTVVPGRFLAGFNPSSGGHVRLFLGWVSADACPGTSMALGACPCGICIPI